MDKLMTLIDVSKELGVSRMTVYRLVRVKAIDSYRVGSQYRVSRYQLDKYLAENRVKANGNGQ